jgi:hypothetical protein
MSKQPTNTMPQDTSNKNGSSPQRRNGTTFLIPDITYVLKASICAQKTAKPSMDQHAKILQMLSRIPKNNTSVATGR